MKRIRFQPHVPAEVRAIDQRTAISILESVHRYAATGVGDVKPLSGQWAGLLRLRAGNHRVLFDETADEMVIHRVAPRHDAYR